MATKTFYLANWCGDRDLYAAGLPEVITGKTLNAATNWGTTVIGKLAAGSFARMRFGAASAVTTANTATTSFIDSATAPLKGTGVGAGLSSDSWRAGPYRGSFASGNWVFTFVVRTTVSTATGRFRVRVWQGPNADGTSATAITTATQVSGIATMSAINTNQTVTITWAAPAITLAGEYLFFQIEWQEQTSAGGSTSAAIALQTNSTRVVTTNWTQGTDNLFTPVNDPLTALGSWYGTAFISGVQQVNNAVISIVGGRMRVTASSTNQFPAGQLKLTGLIPGNSYTFSVDYFYTATGNVFATIRGDFLGVQGSVYDSGDLTASGTINVTIVPDSATEYIVLLCDTSAANFSEYDNCVFTQVNTDTAITLTALTIGSPDALNMSVVVQDHVVIQTPLTIGSPVLPTFVAPQVHRLSLTGLSTSSPVLPNVIVQVTVYPTALTIGSPVLPNLPSFTQVHAAIQTPLTTGSPTGLTGFVATQVHSVSLTPLTAGSPSLPTLPVTGVHSVSLSALSTSSPSLPTFGATQKHVAVQTPLTIGSPALPTFAVTQVQGITFTPLTVSSPSLPTLLATQVHTVVETPLSTSSPVLPTFGVTQRHALAIGNLSIGSPGLPTFGIEQAHAVSLTALAAASPVLPTIAVEQVLPFTALTTGSPVLPTYFASQTSPSYGIDPLTVASPDLPTLVAVQVHVVALTPLSIASPVLPNFANTQVQSILATAMDIGSPVLPTLTVSQVHGIALSPLAIGSPALPNYSAIRGIGVTFTALAVSSPVLPTYSVVAFVHNRAIVTWVQIYAPTQPGYSFNTLTIGSPVLPTYAVTKTGQATIVDTVAASAQIAEQKGARGSSTNTVTQGSVVASRKNVTAAINHTLVSGSTIAKKKTGVYAIVDFITPGFTFAWRRASSSTVSATLVSGSIIADRKADAGAASHTTVATFVQIAVKSATVAVLHSTVPGAAALVVSANKRGAASHTQVSGSTIAGRKQAAGTASGTTVWTGEGFAINFNDSAAHTTISGSIIASGKGGRSGALSNTLVYGYALSVYKEVASTLVDTVSLSDAHTAYKAVSGSADHETNESSSTSDQKHEGGAITDNIVATGVAVGYHRIDPVAPIDHTIVSDAVIVSHKGITKALQEEIVSGAIIDFARGVSRSIAHSIAASFVLGDRQKGGQTVVAGFRIPTYVLGHRKDIAADIVHATVSDYTTKTKAILSVDVIIDGLWVADPAFEDTDTELVEAGDWTDPVPIVDQPEPLYVIDGVWEPRPTIGE